MTESMLASLLSGFWVTLKLTLAAGGMGVLLSFLVGVSLFARLPGSRLWGGVYVRVFRGTSALVQLFWFYFVFPLIGIHLSAFFCGFLALGLNMGAYGAEVVRSTLANLPAQQQEAALTLGFGRWATLLHVLVPQALLQIWPPMTNLLIELLKGTALVSLITLPDLTFQAQALRSATLQTPLIFGWVLILYFAAAQVISRVSCTAERRIGRWAHGGPQA